MFVFIKHKDMLMTKYINAWILKMLSPVGTKVTINVMVHVKSVILEPKTVLKFHNKTKDISL